MADDRFTDPSDESDESTPVPGDEQPAELSDAEIVDPEDTAGDGYVDDPTTPDVNEAKLDRATDEAAAEETENPGSVSPRRPRATRPVRRGATSTASAEADDAADTASEDDATDPAEGKKVARKERATRTRKQAEKERASRTAQRTTPAGFVRESVGELRKVVWPTGNQVQQYFLVVLVFVVFIIAIVSALDLLFGWLVLKAFG